MHLTKMSQDQKFLQILIQRIMVFVLESNEILQVISHSIMRIFSTITQQQNLNITLQLLYPTVWAQKLAAWNSFMVSIRTVFLKMKREKNYYSIPQKLVVGRKTFHIIFKHFLLKMFSKKITTTTNSCNLVETSTEKKWRNHILWSFSGVNF